MLGKMFSYDFKALARILLPLQIAVVIVSVVCCIAGFTGNMSYEYDFVLDRLSAGSSDLVMGISLVIVGMSMLLLFCSAIATFIVILVRFFRNLFTDEGYLTLTLPLKPWQLLMSKVLAGLVWVLINAVIVLVGLAVFSITSGEFSMSSPSDIIPIWILQAANGGLMTLGDEVQSIAALWGLMAGTVLQMLFSLLLAYASFCLGAAAASKHKIAAGVCIFIGVCTLYNMFYGIMAVSIYIGSPLSWNATQTVLSLMGLFMELAIIVGSWFICLWVLKRHVNLN